MALALGLVACTPPEPSPVQVVEPPPTATFWPTATAQAMATPSASVSTSAQAPAETSVPPANTPEPTATAVSPTPTPPPTATPSANPSLAPTATPSPTSTPEPAPTSTPTPRPTSTPAPPNPIAGLKDGARLERNKPALANQLKALPWVADGVDISESRATELLVTIAWRYPDVFEALMKKPWLLDGVPSYESTAIYEIRWMAHTSPNLASRILAKSWMDDGITRDETIVIDRMSSTIRAENESLQSEVIRQVTEILDMPFLDSVESPDAMAVRSLESFEDAGSAEFLELMTHPAVSDGIDDEEAKIITLMAGTNKYKPELVSVLLDGSSVFKEERIVNLPHSGKVLLAIIRFHDRVTPSPNMDYLEYVVRHHEGFMGEPLPTNYVVWYFVDYVSSGHHAGTHIASNPERDPAIGEYWRAPRHAAHEGGHYYWRASEAWISEGGADMLVILSENARVGRPLVHNREQCTSFNTISEIADAEAGGDKYSCSYRLGQRLFLDLYHALGKAAFQRAFRNLYSMRLRDDPTDDCEGTELALCHVEMAFKSGTSEETAAKVDKLIGHWYYGRTGSHDGDRAGLVALYHEMNGPNWTNSANWLSDAHIGEWYGVTTDADGRVIELDLEDNGVSGPIPPQLASLVNLRELLLGYNRLRGQVPAELGGLASLTKLELNNNDLVGEIPSSLGNLTNLTWLRIDDNELTGAIPSTLGSLSNLTRFNLDDNRLTGAIPDSLSNLAALRHLRLAGDNQLTGCLPAGLPNVANNDVAHLGLPSC